ncbi:MAG: NUDIX hydrolase [Balneolaceae bacterium]|nr:MAG: NUDIX hydrolase [Balneolaceae bacterium]
MQRIKAAGGVLFRYKDSLAEILLIKRNGFWDLPKGKVENRESIEKAAMREVEEETGVKNIFIRSYLCETYHEYVQKGKAYGKTTYWYLMDANGFDGDTKPQTEEGITETEWTHLKKAFTIAHFDNLKSVIAEASKNLYK